MNTLPFSAYLARVFREIREVREVRECHLKLLKFSKFPKTKKDPFDERTNRQADKRTSGWMGVKRPVLSLCRFVVSSLRRFITRYHTTPTPVISVIL